MTNDRVFRVPTCPAAEASSQLRGCSSRWASPPPASGGSLVVVQPRPLLHQQIQCWPKNKKAGKPNQYMISYILVRIRENSLNGFLLSFLFFGALWASKRPRFSFRASGRVFWEHTERFGPARVADGAFISLFCFIKIFEDTIRSPGCAPGPRLHKDDLYMMFPGSAFFFRNLEHIFSRTLNPGF